MEFFFAVWNMLWKISSGILPTYTDGQSIRWAETNPNYSFGMG